MIPCSRMESASSARDASSKCLRAGGTAFHLGNGQVQAAGALRLQYVVAQQAPRPRPRPEGFLDAMGTLLSRESGALLFQKLRRKGGVGLRAPGGPIIGGDGLAVAGRLAEAHVPGDHSGIDLAGGSSASLPPPPCKAKLVRPSNMVSSTPSSSSRGFRTCGRSAPCSSDR